MVSYLDISRRDPFNGENRELTCLLMLRLRRSSLVVKRFEMRIGVLGWRALEKICIRDSPLMHGLEAAPTILVSSGLLGLYASGPSIPLLGAAVAIV